jgi:DNA-binding LacI/PurR family transcriptional regulator
LDLHQFKYYEVSEYISKKIEDETYPVGTIIPSQREISKKLSVTRTSVRKAVELLEKKGMLECRPSIGTVVMRKYEKKELIGYLVTNLEDPFHLEMIRSMDGILSRNNAGLVVAEGYDSNRLIGMGITKIIKAGQIHEEDLPDSIDMVYIGKESSQIGCVYVDDMKGMSLVYDHLTELGHSQIIYISARIESVQQTDIRFENLRSLCLPQQRRYLEEFSFIIDSYSDAAFKDILNKIINLEKRPTALVCSSDWLAIKLIQEALKIGIRVPDDFSITGFDNIYWSNTIGIPLTTVAYPIAEAAESAVNILLSSKSKEAVKVKCTPQLIVRKSTGKK